MNLSLNYQLIFDLGSFILCATLLGIYQWRLRVSTRDNPTATVQGMNAQARQAWVEHVMTSTGHDIMAVQTFRNSTMAATLMASTAVLLIFGIFNILASADKITSTFHSINLWGSHEPAIRNFKLMVLLIEFFVGFFCFALAVRGYHHAGYMINVSLKQSEHHGITVQKVVQMLNRTSGYYSMGMRSYYFSVPVVMWLFGPLWMFLATLALLVVLNHLDHLPD